MEPQASRCTLTPCQEYDGWCISCKTWQTVVVGSSEAGCALAGSTETGLEVICSLSPPAGVPKPEQRFLPQGHGTRVHSEPAPLPHYVSLSLHLSHDFEPQPEPKRGWPHTVTQGAREHLLLSPSPSLQPSAHLLSLVFSWSAFWPVSSDDFG